jgi:hypothetical protein
LCAGVIPLQSELLEAVRLIPKTKKTKQVRYFEKIASKYINIQVSRLKSESRYNYYPNMEIAIFFGDVTFLANK